MLILSCRLTLIVICVCALSSCSKPAPFSTETFQEIDGEQKSIKFISGDELELRDKLANYVCKYKKDGNTLRVTENFGGAVRAFYFDIIPAGLRQDNGTMFYSPSGLADKRAEIRRQQEAEQAKQRVAQERLANLTAQSRRETRVVTTVKVRDPFTSSHEPTGEVTVTDVSIKIQQIREGKDYAKQYWFGEMGSIGALGPRPGGPERFIGPGGGYIVINYGPYGLGMSEETVYPCDAESVPPLAASLDSAWSAWHAKYPEVQSLYHPPH